MTRINLIFMLFCVSISVTFSQSKQKVVRDFEISHQKIIKLDSTFILDNATYRLKVTLTKTSKKFKVPTKYLKIYKIKKYHSFDYISKIDFFKNGQPIGHYLIKKSDFKGKVDEPLIDYGILYFPYIEYRNNLFVINYSLTIPLTDIGEVVELTIGKDGAIKF
jgi:hypothetical protein